MTMNRARKALHGARGLVAFVRLMRDPSRLNEVFELADGMDRVHPEVVRQMAEGFRRDEAGARALRERPRLGLPDLEALGSMAPGTLGRAFAEHMRRNGLDPAALPQRPAQDELEYVLAHLYETHDIWHAVTGFDTDVAGELGLQAFYIAQVEGRLGLMLMAMGLLNATVSEEGFQDRRRRLDAMTRGWLLGRRARPLFGRRWDQLWERPLQEVRAELGLALDEVDSFLKGRGEEASGQEAAGVLSSAA
jgi:ubiquinone biosynthesis protein Coq4